MADGSLSSGNATYDEIDTDVGKSINGAPKLTRKDRKRSHCNKTDMFEGIMAKVVKTIADGLRESYRLFIELEEKRMESEERQRREERQFQLQLAQLLAGQPTMQRPPTEFHSPSSYYPNYPPASQCYSSPLTSYYRQGSEGSDIQ